MSTYPIPSFSVDLQSELAAYTSDGLTAYVRDDGANSGIWNRISGVWTQISTIPGLPLFQASGANHRPGTVPDPGATPGTTRFLREDATFAVPAGGSGYTTIEDEGTPLTARTTLNFVGAGVSAADSGGKTVVTIPGGAGSGATGTTTVDFGAFPGASDTSVAVTGQASIVAGSIVKAWLRLEATADHTADEHMLETINIFAGNIVAATGFTIYAINSSQINEGLERRRETTPIEGGKGTRIYGLWTVAWKWE